MRQHLLRSSAPFLSPSIAAQDQWPRFLGLNAGNVADDPRLPDTSSDTENVVLKTDIRGSRWAGDYRPAPLVYGGYGSDEEMCFNFSYIAVQTER